MKHKTNRQEMPNGIGFIYGCVEFTTENKRLWINIRDLASCNKMQMQLVILATDYNNNGQTKQHSI